MGLLESEIAVDEQTKDLREYKKQAKAKELPKIEPVQMVVEPIAVYPPEEGRRIEPLYRRGLNAVN
jgi:hypothetical protein